MRLAGKENRDGTSWYFHYIQQHNLAPLLGGLTGGSASTISLYPLDLIKVRMQVNEKPYHFLTGKTNTNKIKMNQPTVFSLMRGVVQKEGVLGLYQGLSPAIVGSAVSWGGYFFIYESFKRVLLRQKQNQQQNTPPKIDLNKGKVDIKLGALENFTAACAAGAILVLVTNPIWLVKTRMQLQVRQIDAKSEHSSPMRSTLSHLKNSEMSKVSILRPYTGTLDALQTIIKEEGPVALYKGAVPALLLVSHGGVQFVAYEFLKQRFGVYTRSKRTNYKENDTYQYRNFSAFAQLRDSMGYLTMGAVSKMIASTVTYPLQVVKSRLQQRSDLQQSNTSNKSVEKNALHVTSIERASCSQTKPYTGVIDCMRRVLINEGAHGFFKGCLPNAIRVAPSAAITFLVYESVIDLFIEKKE